MSARADIQSCRSVEKSDGWRASVACYEALIAGTSDPRLRVSALTDLAWLHSKVGEFERSLSDFSQVLALSRSMHDRTLEARTINFTGLLYQNVGDPSAALDRYKEALTIALETGDRKLHGEIYYHLGWVNFLFKDYNAAIRYYKESLAARRDAADRNGEAITLLGLGMTSTALNDFASALRYEREALPITREAGNRHAEADALDHIGLALTLSHHPEDALEMHARALQIRRDLGERFSLGFSLSSMSRAQHDVGRVADAAATMAELIEIIEGSRQTMHSRRFRGAIFAKMHGHYERYISYLMELRDPAAAFAISERARARLTLDTLQEALVRAEAAVGGTLEQREQSLQNQIENAGANLESLVTQLADVEKEIRDRYPRIAAAREEQPLNAKQVQSELLDRDTAVVEYALWEEKSFAWVLTRDEIRGIELAKRADIEPLAIRLHALLSAGDRRVSQHEIQTLLDRLSASIVEPLKLPSGISRLIIVPDGALFYTPFVALRDRQRALIDHYEITIAPSASAVALMRRMAGKRTYADAAVIFADPVFRADDERVGGPSSAASRHLLPASGEKDLVRAVRATGLSELRRLPATRNEADAITRLVGGGTREALDFAASRKTVMSEDLSRYRVVHFATHALVNAQQPKMSGIVLSLVDERGAPVNGFLRVHELFALNMETDLVVLSACRTALGKELRGEGIVGLVSGFLHAGSPRVVASYWDVKDEATAELMKRFYDRMFRQNLPAAAALRAAQQSMRREKRWKSPYYWAAFAIYGVR